MDGAPPSQKDPSVPGGDPVDEGGGGCTADGLGPRAPLVDGAVSRSLSPTPLLEPPGVTVCLRCSFSFARHHTPTPCLRPSIQMPL